MKNFRKVGNDIKVIDAKRTGEKIKEYAMKHKLKNYEIAEMLNCSIATISYWYTGRNIPSAQYFVNLCEIFNCKFEDLIVFKNEFEENEFNSNETDTRCDLCKSRFKPNCKLIEITRITDSRKHYIRSYDFICPVKEQFLIKKEGKYHE